MRPKSTQDLATGLMFLAVGIAGLVIGWNYPMGTAQRPDTGVLPRILSWCLVGTGGLHRASRRSCSTARRWT